MRQNLSHTFKRRNLGIRHFIADIIRNWNVREGSAGFKQISLRRLFKILDLDGR